jgi:EmrB/QacA subfamily drug resistance transporter
MKESVAERPAADESPVGVALHSGRGVALIAATVLASMVSFLDANVVNVAIPAIGRTFGVGTAALQWCLTGYLLTVASLLLVSGSLADRFGRRRVLQAGLIIMFGASILCAAAPTAGVLIGARVIQGMGAALVVPSSLALLNGALIPDDRARGIGIWAGLATLGTTVGPYAGGWLVDHASWRWVFLLNLPLILACLWALRRVPDSIIARVALSLDALGALAAVLGLGGVIYALTAGPAHGWSSAPVLIAAVIGALALSVLVPIERRRRAPLLRLSLFSSRQFDAINLTTVLFYGGLGAASYLLILQCELQLSYSATQAGAVLIPESAVFLSVAPLSGILVARIGPRWLMVAGIVAVAGAFSWISAAQPGSSYATAILPGVLLWGLGIGLAVTPLTAAVLAAVNDHDLGEAAALNDAASRLGGLIAISLVPAVIGATGGRTLAHALTHGFQPAMLGLAGCCAVAALITAIFVSDDRRTAPVPAFGPPQPHGCIPPLPAATAMTSAGRA